MKKGAIPIPYIIALIFGVIVISLIGYWLTTQGSKTITTGNAAECNSKQYTFCIQWKNTAFRDDARPPALGFDVTCAQPTKSTCEELGLGPTCVNRGPSCISGETDCGSGISGTRKCCVPSCP
jgi:hypothetical protein